MKRIALVFLVVLAGCGKKAESPTAPVAEQVSETPAAATAPVAMPELEQQLNGTVHPEMTMRLQMFRQLKGRLPESIYELQNMPGFDSTPGLPFTMKYEIDPKDKTVKVVKK